MYVCVCVCMYVCMFMYVQPFEDKCRLRVYVSILVCKYTNKSKYVRLKMYVYMLVCMYSNISTRNLRIYARKIS